MLINILTGIISTVLIIFSLLYPLLRKQKSFASLKKLKFHCMSGYLSLLAILVHIDFSFNFNLASGYLSLVALIAAIVSGIMKKHINNKIVYTIHLFFITALAVSIIYHVLVSVINLLFM
jgi:hypothetical protein